MPAAITDKFREATNGSRPDPTTLTVQKGIGAASVTCGALTGWATATAVDFMIYQKDASGNKVAGSQTDWIGIVSGSNINSLTLKAGTDQVYPIGSVVEAAPTAAWGDDIAQGIAVEHKQDGTHKDGSIESKYLATTLQQGWQEVSDSWTYASATTITVPAGALNKYSVGDKIKLTQTTVKYFYVEVVGDTLLTINGGTDYTLANAAITAKSYSKAATPLGFPAYFNYTPVWTSSGTPVALGNGTITGAFYMVGRQVMFMSKLTMGSTTTYGTGEYRISTPTTINTIDQISTFTPLGRWVSYDASSTFFSGGETTFVSPTTVGGLVASATTDGLWANVLGQTVPTTWAVNDLWTLKGSYLAA
jgi:hypothetical protein